MGDPEDVVDRGFLEARGKLLEVAAFLDRAERHGRSEDFRVVALKQAMEKLAAENHGTRRAESFLHAMSDPTTEPIERATSPAAGAWNFSEAK